ncbi:tyrosine-type recombinase/integrase [Reyranella sp. MMS21-HV4-11]|uniref:Tyrosine-type recombinase/integrase n=1 Tax=Reyranella humidisoli TaxID=2849149 RepID=A0ABS6IGU2_9HYPH|nr:tyrosine-type recombinase/integrase [Reyranella sp. MMS21-HV4-11]MBU8873685.1 tyrosine-type recombinase/integrase [Reyranella sp. MMS21-HV4-11]
MPRLLPYPAIKPSTWPPTLRRLHDLRQAKPGAFTKRNVAATWRDGTFDLHVWNVSYFVGWLKWTGRLNEHADFSGWVTPGFMGAYVDDMRFAGLSPRTMATRVDGVRAALAALSPETPAAWLMRGINSLRGEPSDRRRTQARTQHTARIVELGVSLMKQAVLEGGATLHQRAILYRDGLIIVFMALAVPRLDTVSLMRLRQHLLRQGDGYRIAWSAREMKENRPHEGQLGAELSALFERYLNEFRPVLAANSKMSSPEAEAAVWFNKRGGPLSARGIYNLIVDRTGAAFDESMFPHAFRHSAATTLVLERPDLIRLVTPLLQHRDSSSREFYVLADNVEAGHRYGAVIAARRAKGRRPATRRDQSARRQRDERI